MIGLFFEFVDCSSQLFSRDLWDSRHFIGVVDVHVRAAFISIENFWKNSPKTSAVPLQYVMIFSSLIHYLCGEHLLLCRFDSWDVADTFEVFENSLDYLLSFHSFLVSDTFFNAFAHFFQ